MNVGGNHTGGLVTAEAADGNLLTDRNGRIADQVGNGLAAVVHESLGHQGVHISGVGQSNLLGNLVGEADEVIGLGNEVSFAVHFDDRADGAFIVGVLGHNAFSGDTAGLLGSLAQSLFTQPFNGLVHISVALNQSLFAIHHAGAGALAQLFNHSGSNCCHFDQSSLIYLFYCLD